MNIYSIYIYSWLVVWNMNFLTFHILGISSSQLTLTPSFFRGVGMPPTSNHQQSHITGKMMMTHRNLVPYGTLLSEKPVLKKKHIKNSNFHKQQVMIDGLTVTSAMGPSLFQGHDSDLRPRSQPWLAEKSAIVRWFSLL